MGSEYRASCTSCGASFTALVGGGILSDLLHCYRCGGELSVAKARGSSSGEGEDTACACGGLFKHDAPPRCPKCRTPWRAADEPPYALYD